jgi:hypothetical protein
MNFSKKAVLITESKGKKMNNQVLEGTEIKTVPWSSAASLKDDTFPNVFLLEIHICRKKFLLS